MRKQPIQPKVLVQNRQRKIAVNRPTLERFARRTLLLCSGEQGTSLTNIEEIAILLISDRRIAELHRRFMQIDGPTDVITFQHGEIFISVETAQRQAKAHGISLVRELQLYLVHGLLHLHGFDDRDLASRRRMHSVQEKIILAAASGVSKSR